MTSSSRSIKKHSYSFFMGILFLCGIYSFDLRGAVVDDDEGRIPDFRTQMQSLRSWVDSFIEDVRPYLAQQKRFVLLIGNTDAGKSTLLHCLDGRELWVKKPPGYGLRLFPQEGERPLKGNKGDVEIGNSSTSTTLLPNLVQCGETLFIDLPGLNDTRTINGMPRDIANAFVVKTLFERLKNVSILLVTTESSVDEGKVEELFGVLDYVGKVFTNDRNLVGSTSLLITKSKELSKADIILRLAEKLKSPDYMASLIVRELAQSLMKEDGKRIGFFPFPERELLNKKYPEEYRESILELIKPTVLRHILVPRVSVEVTKQSSREYLQNTYDAIDTDLKTLLIDEMHQIIFESITTDIATLPYNRIRQRLIGKKADLESLDGSIGQDQGQFMKKMNTVLAKVVPEDRKEELSTRITNLVENRDFIRDIWPLIRVNGMRNWTSPLTLALHDLTAILDSGFKPTLELDGDTAIVRGFLLGLSDVNKKLEHEERRRFLKVYCWGTLFLDEDLDYPGTHIALISPRWKIEGDERTINIKGDDAQEYEEASVEGDGSPGKAGKNGGHFFGKGLLFSSDSESGRLVINTGGGKGGNGQKGEQGQDGSNGVDGVGLALSKSNDGFIDLNCPFITSSRKMEDLFKYRNIFGILRRETLALEKWQLSCESIGTFGTPGLNGKKGGRKGEGGHAGSIELSVPGLENRTLVHTRGVHGNDGASGAGGKGGRNGISQKGLFLEERPKFAERYPFLRGILASFGTGMTGGAGGAAVGAAVLHMAIIPVGIVGGVVSFVGAGVYLLSGDSNHWIEGPRVIAANPTHQPDGRTTTGVNSSGTEFRAVAQIGYDLSSNYLEEYISKRKALIARIVSPSLKNYWIVGQEELS